MTTERIVDFFNNSFYKYILKTSVSGATTVLDVGCGSHSMLGKVRGKFNSTGIDIFKGCIADSRKEKNHDKYILGDIRNLSKYFKNKSFDVVVSVDVIEHLTKKEALSMIRSMEKIAKKRIVIMTPNGFYPQSTLFGNPHQVHKSGWYVADLENLGYKTYGLRGLKYIRGIHATIRYKPWFFWAIITCISEPLLYFFPNLSYHIFAVKDIS